jgi:predicted DNA-binding ribbon-helix-helix protein
MNLVQSSVRRKGKNKSVRKTVQLSNDLMDMIEERAAEETLPVASVIRRAVADYLKLYRDGSLPDVNLDGLEQRERKGARGPAPQWPVSVSYVLSDNHSHDVEQLSRERGESVADIVRCAIGLALAREVSPERPMSRLPHGFVTKDHGESRDKSERIVIDVLHEIRGNKV